MGKIDLFVLVATAGIVGIVFFVFAAPSSPQKTPEVTWKAQPYQPPADKEADQKPAETDTGTLSFSTFERWKNYSTPEPFSKRLKDYLLSLPHLSPSGGDITRSFSGKHEGVDYRSTSDTTVRSSARGRVTGVGSHPRYGQFVRISHENSYSTFYAFLGDTNISEGEQVQAGEIIGETGTSNHVSNGFHYEVIKYNKPLNPEGFLP